jgi:ATP-dependent DNA helicase PIF1
MSEQNLKRKAGRPAKYQSLEEKAQADVDRRRELRQREAYERRERVHAQFYGVTPSPSEGVPKSRELEIVLEDPAKNEAILRSPDFLACVHKRADSLQDAANNDTHHQVKDTQVDQPKVSAGPDLCKEQVDLVELVLSGANVFYTGGAGTGKSTVLRAMVREFQKRRRSVQVVTPTGISALNVGGSTYFTYAGWNPGVVKKSIKEIRAGAMSKERRQRVIDTDVLIIDEISMLESNQFRRPDQACRAAKGCTLAFGGLQVIVTGDFYQLPPVKAFQTCYKCGTELKTRAFCRDCELSLREGAEVHQPPASRQRKSCLQCGIDLEKRMDCPKCECRYDQDDQWAFRSDTWEACNFHCISLKQVHRQNDPTFVDILNTLRVGERLNSRQLSLLGGRESEVGEAVELSPVRREVDEKNRVGFQAIQGVVRTYKCQDHVHIQTHHLHLASKAELDGDGNRVGCQEHRFPPYLEVKFGMPVILLANIEPLAGLVNGSQGKVVGFSPHKPLMLARERKIAESGEFSRLEEHQIVSWTGLQTPEFPLPVVRFENGLQRVVYPVCQDTELGDPPPFSVVARTQIPLLPAWAITIHKSQGMTLERAVVNLDHIFEPQMAYVALSRARSLKGLKVVSRVGLDMLQERGMLGGSSRVVKAFMEGIS